MDTLLSYFQWLKPNGSNRNLVSAFFHMITIALISTSLVQLSWFQITGGFCVPHLSVYTFFTFGYVDTPRPQSYNIYHQEFEGSSINIDYGLFEESFKCITPKIVNMMRIIILLCFMSIIFSLFGFFLDILAPKSKVYEFIRKNSIAGCCTVLWIIAVMSISFYVAYLLEDSLKDKELYLDLFVEVNFEYGFYTVVAAGIVAFIGVIINLFLAYIPNRNDGMDRRYLINDWEDVESFPMPPPPPYSAPPPPYTP